MFCGGLIFVGGCQDQSGMISDRVNNQTEVLSLGALHKSSNAQRSQQKLSENTMFKFLSTINNY